MNCCEESSKTEAPLVGAHRGRQSCHGPSRLVTLRTMLLMLNPEFFDWLPMFPGDSRDWAKTRSDEFSDKRVSYYWDGDRLTGQQWQKVLGTKGVAWDIYLFYGAQSRWDKEPPAPDFWMHQLRGETSAPTLNGADFVAKVKEMLSQMER